MSRTKGTPKTGGRTKGTQNKVTTGLKMWLSELLDMNREQIEKDFKQLEPKDRLQMFEKFLQYTMPKMQSVQTQTDFNKLTDVQLDSIINELTKDIQNNNTD